ncbi:TPA: hypothetical protein L4F79_005939 [Pseudomonas aeruginosa]|nr:hypothetical protein [Pseudomonas aeruginosa]HBO1675653.1 hypothetical protein [Pseudomonas aeruginosa]HBO2047105.1 hypothetical protein [Pseudomonas aeruginosa]HBO2059578.1 hypothetical protein [Pseudomonas aeruginosa]HBO2228523.1 hypothetical protein [Pseudomonas aeruginosa]
MNIDPNWITSILLFVIGAFLIAICVLALLLIESKRAKARIEATLETSVARHKVLLQEHRAEIEVIEDQHQVQLAKLAMTHSQELDGMRGILAISDLDRDEALRNTDAAKRHAALLRNQLDEIHVFLESCSAGTDETSMAIRHRLFQIHSEAC